MSITAIIPVFNAAPFVRKCLESCIEQKELSEIIVINDGCTDDTMRIVDELKSLDSRIVAYHHMNKERLGRSASRNLGIRKSNSEWITFCDADDYYLENRFNAFVNETKNDIDGFYEDVQSVYAKDVQKNAPELTGISDDVPAVRLQEFLMENRDQSISIISLIVRKNILENLSFDESLTTGEDTDFIWRLAGLTITRMIVAII